MSICALSVCRFVQSSIAQSQAAGGTGLGLAIRRAIVFAPAGIAIAVGLVFWLALGKCIGQLRQSHDSVLHGEEQLVDVNLHAVHQVCTSQFDW